MKTLTTLVLTAALSIGTVSASDTVSRAEFDAFKTEMTNTTEFLMARILVEQEISKKYRDRNREYTDFLFGLRDR